jgi:hypothetical protein
MATPAQIAANRANSQKSTGPTSTEGKAASSLNRLSHGFTSVTRVIPGEDPEALKSLHLALLDELQPATMVETILIEKMSLNQWLSLRAFRLQTQAFARQASPMVDGDTPKELGLLIRYQTAADRAFHKAHAELLKLQKERKKSEIGFVRETVVQTYQAAPQPAEQAPETPASTVTTEAKSVVAQYLEEELAKDAPFAESVLPQAA